MKQANSATITSPSPARKQSASTGRKLSTTGSGQTIAPSQTVEQELEALLPQSVKSAMQSQMNKDYDLTGFKMTQQVSLRDYETALALLSKALEPSDKAMVLKELTKLKLKTTTKNMDAAELKMQLGVYTDELAKYPPDIVTTVLAKWAEQSKWWPTWHELHRDLEWRTNKRQWKLEALSKGI